MRTAAELELLVAVDKDDAFLLSFPDHGLGETTSTEKNKARGAFIAAPVDELRLPFEILVDILPNLFPAPFAFAKKDFASGVVNRDEVDLSHPRPPPAE